MRKELSDSAREGPAYKKIDRENFGSNSENPYSIIPYGPGNFLLKYEDGTIKNSTLA